MATRQGNKRKIDSALAPQSSVMRAFVRTFTNEKKTRDQIRKAGLTDVISWESWVFLKLAALVLAVTAVLAFGTWRDWDFGLVEWVVMGILVALMALPGAKLKDKAKLRTRAVNRELADTLDLLVACVEAGQSLPQAMLFTATERPDSVLSYEFMYGLNQMDNGRTFHEALSVMGDRVESREFKLSLGAMREGMQNGSPLGPILKKQADMVREMRKQAAHEWAAKIPVKLMIPLVFCIFPALLIVVLGPAVINIYRAFILGEDVSISVVEEVELTNEITVEI